MNIHQLFPSKWLSPADLGSRSFDLTIKAVTMQEVRNPQTNQMETKPAVAFERAQKMMLLNKTQCFAIADIVGAEETDNWKGKNIVLRTGKARNGKDTIVVQRPASKGPVAPTVENFTIPENDNPFEEDEE